MGKKFVILLLVMVAACAHNEESAVAVVEPVPEVTVIKPVAKPRPPVDVNSKEYTAPYPTLPLKSSPATTASVTVKKEMTVIEKVEALPPDEIEEGKYRTFRRIEDDVAYDTRTFRGAIAEFIFPEMNEVIEIPVGRKQPEAFCYGSLADATCYSKPIKGQEFRRVGK